MMSMMSTRSSTMIYQLRELPRYKTRTRGSHRNPLTEWQVYHVRKALEKGRRLREIRIPCEKHDKVVCRQGCKNCTVDWDSYTLQPTHDPTTPLNCGLYDSFSGLPFVPEGDEFDGDIIKEMTKFLVQDSSELTVLDSQLRLDRMYAVCMSMMYFGDTKARICRLMPKAYYLAQLAFNQKVDGLFDRADKVEKNVDKAEENQHELRECLRSLRDSVASVNSSVADNSSAIRAQGQQIQAQGKQIQSTNQLALTALRRGAQNEQKLVELGNHVSHLYSVLKQNNLLGLFEDATIPVPPESVHTPMQKQSAASAFFASRSNASVASSEVLPPISEGIAGYSTPAKRPAASYPSGENKPSAKKMRLPDGTASSLDAAAHETSFAAPDTEIEFDVDGVTKFPIIPLGRAPVEPDGYKKVKLVFNPFKTFGNGSEQMNTILRSGEQPTGVIKQNIDTLTNALQDWLPNYQGTVYRGASLDMATILVMCRTKTFCDLAFLSASAGGIHPKFADHNCRFIIISKTGKYIQPYVTQSMKEENEVTFAPRTNFDVVSVKKAAVPWRIGQDNFIITMVEK